MNMDRKQLEQHIDLYTQRAISISITSFVLM